MFLKFNKQLSIYVTLLLMNIYDDLVRENIYIYTHIYIYLFILPSLQHCVLAYLNSWNVRTHE